MDQKTPPIKIELSVVIPAYNEENRLPQTLESIIAYFDQRKFGYEVIVVDDGSVDGTAKVVGDLTKIYSQIKLISYQDNRGKGYAVRQGMMQAIGNLVLYNDADGATPISEIERLEIEIKSGADVAIGSRAMFSKDTSVKTVWYRKYLGRIFNRTVNFLILPGIADTQCGFKMFKQAAAKEVFSKQTADRYSFDVELLFLARKAGLRIVEVPINWINIPGSKVNLVKDAAVMLKDIMRFRLWDLMGKY